MTRMKKARSRELDRSARCKSAKNRPLCPSCGARMPPPGASRDDWLLPHGHRRQDGDVCPGFKTRPTIAPPPPMAKPQPRWVDPAARPSPTISLEDWYRWFDENQATAPDPWKSPTPRAKQPKRPLVAPGQLLLFTADALWCDAQPANNQKRYPLVRMEPPPRLQTG